MNLFPAGSAAHNLQAHQLHQAQVMATQSPQLARVKKQNLIPKSQSANNLTLMSQNALQERAGAGSKASQFAPNGSNRGTRRKGKQQDKQQVVDANSGNALQSQTSSGQIVPRNSNAAPSDDVTNKSQASGRSRRGRIPKNKSFGYLESLKKSASAMVKDDLIPLNDAGSNLSNKQRLAEKHNTLTGDNLKQGEDRSMSGMQNVKPPSEAAPQSPQSRNTRYSKKDQYQRSQISIGQVPASSVVNADLFMGSSNVQVQKVKEMTNIQMTAQEEHKEPAVNFDLPKTRRSRSKNQQSSVDTVTGEKKKRGRRSQSDSTKRVEQRLAKNRISAANSRKRRKKYIEQLEDQVIAAEEQRKEIIRLKTIVEGQKKQLQFQEPVQAKTADQFFMERIDDFVNLEEMVLNSDEKNEEMDSQEMRDIIARLNQQSGPYGIKRTELLNNLFKSILEMSLPGFIEYLFYGFEQRENGSVFFNAETYENSMAGSQAGEDIEEPSQEMSFEQEMLGYDAQTGKEFSRVRKRKPLRYYIPGLVGGQKSSASIKQYRESLRWLNLNPEQLNSLHQKRESVSGHYQKFKKLFETLIETKEKLLIEMHATDQTVSELQDLLTPEQAGKFLLLSDKMKLKQEFDFSILCESRKRKESLQTHMIDRILQNEEGKPILRRPEQSESSVDPQLQSLNQHSGVGLQQMGDKSEVYEDSDSEENSSNKIVFKAGFDDDEPPNSSDFSNEIGQIKSILKKKNSQNSGSGAASFKTPHVPQNQISNQAHSHLQPQMEQVLMMSATGASQAQPGRQSMQNNFRPVVASTGGALNMPDMVMGAHDTQSNQLLQQSHEQPQVNPLMEQAQQLVVGQMGQQTPSLYSPDGLPNATSQQQQLLQQQMQSSSSPSVHKEEESLHIELGPEAPMTQTHQGHLGGQFAAQQTLQSEHIMATESEPAQLGQVSEGFNDFGFDTQMQPNEQAFRVEGTSNGFKKEKVFPDDSSYEDVNRI